MTSATRAGLREARVGDLLPDDALAPRSVRGVEATALVLPGSGNLDGYLAPLEQARDAFAAWDGRVLALEPDGAALHRVLVVDRYGQVYHALDAPEQGLPDAAELEEWFRFLTTACPECGVLDDPIGRGWVP
ncbi:MAG TPA: hypothetical protein VF013_11465 [Candidatus Limnocylindria bacterium]